MRTLFPALVIIVAALQLVRSEREERPVSVRGRVVQASDSSPLRGAVVSIDDARPGTPTDTIGGFHFDTQLSTGKHHITVRYIGFKVAILEFSGHLCVC